MIQETADVILIGAGIMSATLGAMLEELEPGLKIEIYERLDKVAEESSDAWNNAGTGHSAFCELNYTPMLPDGSVDITKALGIAASFEVSKEFWAYLVSKKHIPSPRSFINSVPHMSLVSGDENIRYLKKRYDAMTRHHLFKGMEYSDSRDQLKEWIPLVIEGRDQDEKLAATRMELGTDINFGSLTRCLIEHLTKRENIRLHLCHEVRNITRNKDSSWTVTIKNTKSGEKKKVSAGFVFIGAGGAALPLLEKSGIPEAAGYGGFPVSGQWLVCNNQEIIERHGAKVYGKPGIGTPPMSVPHLDTRIIDGKKGLLFGPFAGFSTKFLKKGSYLDLPLSIRFNNIIPMLSAGLHNIPLSKYLIQQVRLTQPERMKALREYFPKAKSKDWRLAIAGQRVQVIKKDPEEGGILQFGTEAVHAADGSLAALLGASPGASTSVSIMLDLLGKCFASRIHSKNWNSKLLEMIPSYGRSLVSDEKLCEKVRADTSRVLQLVRDKLQHR